MVTARRTAAVDHDESMSEQSVPRLSARSFFQDVADELFSLDRGIPYTLGQLLLRPGPTIRRYVELRDARLTRPFRLVLIVLAAAAALLHLAGAGDVGDGISTAAPATETSSAALNAATAIFTAHFDLFLVLGWVPGIAAGVQGLYRRHALNYAEAFVFGLYTLPQMLLWLLPLVLLVATTGAAPAWLMPLLAMAPVARSAHGYFRPEQEPLWRALLCTLFGAFSVAVLMLGALMAMVVWNIAAG